MKSQYTYPVLIATRILVTTLAVFSGVALTAQAATQIQPQGTTSQGVEIAQQSILYVNPQQGTDTAYAGTSESAPLKTISYALQQAESGTVIQLAPGQYQVGENFPLQLKPGVTLKGNESQQGQGVVINGGGEYMSRTFARQNIALLAANNTQVNGITVTNPNTRGTAIWVEGTNPIIRNSTFVNSKREGIFVTGAAAPKIQNNQFMNNDANGISVTGQAKGEIRANVFQKTGFGIAIGGTSTPLVVDNQIRDSRSGVVVTEKARPILQGNTIANNSEYGLVVISEAQPQIGTNDLRGNGRQEQLIARVPQNVSTPSDVAAIPTRPPVVTPNQTQPSVVAQTPLQTQTGQVVNFGCVPQGSGFATIAQRGEASIPQPMITWNRDLGPELTPERRCQTVTQRLNHLVLENGGSLDNLLFTVGPVRNNLVVCLVGDIISGCNDKNLLFTMSRENARNATAVLQSLLAFSVTGSGNPVQESEGQPYASLAPVAKNLAPVKGLWFVSSGRR